MRTVPIVGDFFLTIFVNRPLGNGLIDKLDLRIPNATEFRPQFAEMFCEVRAMQGSPFRESQHYQVSGDLRPFGYSAILHMWNKHQKKGDHKLELVDTGEMSRLELMSEPNRIFDIPKKDSDLGIMRIDLAADVPHVPVSWFKNRVRVQYKQWVKEIGTDGVGYEYSEEGKRWVKTIYFGKKPNQLRIYDKVDECRYQYQKLLRRVSKDADVPSFESCYGMPFQGYDLTRVENQFGGGRVPLPISTISKLKDLPEFNPFARLRVECKKQSTPLPQPYQFKDYRTYCTGMFLREMALSEKDGMHRVFQFLNMVSKDAKKKMETIYAAFLPAGPVDESEGLTSVQLYEFYRDSVSKQLAA